VIPLREQEYIKEKFARELVGSVRIDYFTQRASPLFVPGREECAYCEDVRQMLEELAALSDKIKLTVHEFREAREAASRLGVDKIPGIVIRGPANRPIKFYGIPSGHEFPGLIEDIVDASRGKVDLAPETVRRLKKLKQDIAIQVLVTPTCPHCPVVARAAHKMALESPHIRADIVEISEFPRLAQRHQVRGVPTTVFNGQTLMVGAMDERMLLEQVMKVAEGAGLPPPSGQAGPTTPAPETPQQQQPPGGGRLILP
jgi:glutaredoxin-like protein